MSNPSDLVMRPTNHHLHTMPWTWRAIASDGSYIDEMDEEGYDVHGAKDVAWESVILFQLIPCRQGLPTVTVHIDLEKGQRAIYFRRMQADINLSTGGVSPGHLLAHVVGYQETINGENVKHLTYWYENGTCLVTGDDSVN